MDKTRMLGLEREAVAGTEGGRSLTGVPATGDAKPMPDPAVAEKPVRRRFTATYKIRILQEADRCTQSGQLGALLRREGLYSSHLTNWRRQRDAVTLAGLAPKRRGRNPAANAPLIAESERLKRENERLTEKLRQAETIIEIQKKLCEILEIPLPPTDSSGSTS